MWSSKEIELGRRVNKIRIQTILSLISHKMFFLSHFTGLFVREESDDKSLSTFIMGL